MMLLLAGCFDYGLAGEKPDPGEDDTGSRWVPDTSHGIDTGEPCPEVLGLPLPEVDESCLAEPEFGDLTSIVEWETSYLGEYPEYAHTLMAPVVGPLFDGDGDGDIDGDDPPSIVVVMDDGGVAQDHHGVIRVLDGRDGTPQTVISVIYTDDLQVFPYRYSNLALGDIDGDGAAEIVGIATTVGGSPGPDTGAGGPGDPGPDGGGGGGDGLDTGVVVMPAPPSDECLPAAWTPAGDLLWLGDTVVTCSGHAPALADLEGDGAVEVIVGSLVLAGADGTFLWQGEEGEGRPADFTEAGAMSFAADIDGDGTQEVIAGSAIYEADGTLRCSTGEADGFPAVADLDGVGDGEMVVVADGALAIYAADCRRRMSRPLVGEGYGGPPTIGDLDGDGLPEIGVASGESYTTYEDDGTPLWTFAVHDASSSTTGGAFYDFDGDGALEVVYADEETFWILDGRTGAIRLEDDTHSSRTLHELPVVVDVDGDGATEIVVPNGGAHDDTTVATGLYVRGAAAGDWTAARPVWNQHAFAGVNVEDDLSIPASPEPSWPTWNTFRSGTIDPVSGGAWPNAIPVAETCTARCDEGELVLDVAVTNGGMAALRSGVSVHVYAGDEEIGSTVTSAVVDIGGSSNVTRFTLPATAGPLEIRVDEEDRARECHEDDNVIPIDGCP